MSKGKVLVGMSGGVDSSVAAYLLKRDGYEVIGVTMEMLPEQDKSNLDDNLSYCGISAVEDAKRVANKLGIEHHVLDFRSEFKSGVIDYFINEYKAGRTPNPCVVCNRKIKWEALLEEAHKMGADYVATGHYAKIEKYPQTGRYCVRTAITAAKDQTYALYNLTQEQLKSTIMPVGDYTKDEVREIAKEIDLDISTKPDSQDICFVPDGDYAGFIKRYDGTNFKVGNFVDINGNILGKHKGILHYTIGQRKGLGLAMNKHVYVKEIDAEQSRVVICDNEDLFETTIYAKNINFMSLDKIEGCISAEAKIRYAHKKAKCKVSFEDDMLICKFDEPQRAITPGQAIVIYDGDYVLAGGIIEK